MAHGQRVHSRAQSDKNRLVFEIAVFSIVIFGFSTSEVGKVPRMYLAEIECVSEMRARVDLLRQVIHEEVQEDGVGIRVQHSDPVPECVFQKRVESVPIVKETSFTRQDNITQYKSS